MKELPLFSSLSKALSSLEGEDKPCVSEHSVSGGCISSTSVLTLSSGRRILMKKNKADVLGMFQAEASGLKELAQTEEGPRVPAVLACGIDESESFLLLEYIEPGEKGENFWEDFGCSLAKLHRNVRSKYCGLAYDNFIGASRQVNSITTGWIEFFRDCRLGFQIKMARENGLIDKKMQTLLNRVMDRLDQILIPCDDEEASLLHGDLWSGNYMCGHDGKAWIFDPAVSFGHREADLAMTELFGGFSSSFYRGYQKEWPLHPGYHERKDLYNLYHMLNHLNLFGGSYAGSVLSLARQYS
ncbi:fructosamine kinase [Oceanispirochaeta crateris]|uniref:Fructosamine kinase n=1 Tax=Oceanispirochaeta crateris TaxID=2518645 RepID=A0A5C1QKQ8_9SPIO|nr:fructosamine kinase family protein [Oceanispirochaeta crateris]QEN07116.1 fructosamine kinase [Oceanispirochaeta crateris]